jgi:peptide/nickel transport system substrate-binding protein
MSLGDYIELERFDDYWGDPAGVEKLRIVVIPEGTNRLIEVETGAAHIAYDISPHHLQRMIDSTSMTYDRAQVPRYHFLGFNHEVPYLQDIRVRQAINHAVDVQAIMDSVYLGVGTLTHGPLVGLPAVIDFDPFEFDLDRAKELMAEAGYADGFSLTLYNTSDNQQEADTSVILKNMLSQINIDVEIVSVEFATFLQAVTAGEQDMHVLSWNNSMADPDYGLTLFHSNNIGASNRWRYNNPDLDRLLDLGRKELDPAKRLEIYHEAQRVIVADVPAVFLMHGEELVALSPKVRGYVNFPIRQSRLQDVTLVD